MTLIDTPAPDFTLSDQVGHSHTLSSYKGSWVVLYFYPRDNTPGCTKEACTFRDNSKLYIKNSIVVLGVSDDSVSSHKRFYDKFQLTFTLLSDPTHTVIESYDAWKPKKILGKEFLGTQRKTYLIDPKGIIRKVYVHLDLDTHAKEVLHDTKTLTT